MPGGGVEDGVWEEHRAYRSRSYLGAIIAECEDRSEIGVTAPEYHAGVVGRGDRRNFWRTNQRRYTDANGLGHSQGGQTRDPSQAPPHWTLTRYPDPYRFGDSYCD